METTGRICAVCGKPIGGPRNTENVFMAKYITTRSGCGWVAVHVRCARGPASITAAQALPPGKPIKLGGGYELGMA